MAIIFLWGSQKGSPLPICFSYKDGYVKRVYKALHQKKKDNYEKLLIQTLILSAMLGFSLTVTNCNSVTKMDCHWEKERMALSSTMLFRWFQMDQHAMITISLKTTYPNFSVALITISNIDSVVSQWISKHNQHAWLKGQPKNRCKSVSSVCWMHTSVITV